MMRCGVLLVMMNIIPALIESRLHWKCCISPPGNMSHQGEVQCWESECQALCTWRKLHSALEQAGAAPRSKSQSKAAPSASQQTPPRSSRKEPAMASTGQPSMTSTVPSTASLKGEAKQAIANAMREAEDILDEARSAGAAQAASILEVGVPPTYVDYWCGLLLSNAIFFFYVPRTKRNDVCRTCQVYKNVSAW